MAIRVLVVEDDVAIRDMLCFSLRHSGFECDAVGDAPKASWEKIMTNLDNHFGEDASLDTQTTKHITEYLIAEAGDTGFWSSKFLRGLDSQNPPIRITETKYWIREHRGISDAKWKSERVGSKANCAACHRGAERGYYEDD